MFQVNEKQRQAIALKVDKKLNYGQIAKKLGVSRQAVRAYFSKAHVQSALAEYVQHHNIQRRPKLLVDYTEIRDAALSGIKQYLERDELGKLKQDLRVSELVNVLKVVNDAIIDEEGKDAAAEAKEMATDLLVDHLSPEELEMLARRITGGKQNNSLGIIEVAEPPDSESGGAGELSLLPGTLSGDDELGGPETLD